MEEKLRKPVLLIILAITVVYFVTGGVRLTADPVAIALVLALGVTIVYVAMKTKLRD